MLHVPAEGPASVEMVPSQIDSARFLFFWIAGFVFFSSNKFNIWSQSFPQQPRSKHIGNLSSSTLQVLMAAWFPL